MKKLVVLGAGESGVGAAVLGLKKGWRVFVSDRGKIKNKYKNVLLNNSIEWEESSHNESRILAADLIVKSPGIPDNATLITTLKVKGKTVISEIEFAYRYSKAKFICITGSNGKTTTTLLTYHILQNAKVNVGLAGNVGKSLALQVAENNFDWYVVELSSFQLDGMFQFKADIAIIMNITSDHLDRYNYKLQNYIDSKMRICQNLTATDFIIYCQDDPITNTEMEQLETEAQRIPFSIEKTVKNGAYINKNKLIINLKNKQLNMSIYDLALQGKHNIYNSMASGIAARILEIRKDNVRDSLSDFESIEHRLESVVKVHGIKFINDSKATNVNSTWYALESVEAPVIWIVGGVDKGNDYEMLKSLVKDKVKSIICIGKDNSKIREAFADLGVPMIDAGNMPGAVAMAYNLGSKGYTALLSPACASFDKYEDYEDRGRQFKEAVRAL